MKYGIAFHMIGNISSIYRKEFHDRNEFLNIKNAILAKKDFSERSDRFNLVFYDILNDNTRRVVEKYYSSFYPDYLYTFLENSTNTSSGIQV